MTKPVHRFPVRIGLAVSLAFVIAILTTMPGSAIPQPAPYAQEASPTSINCYQAGFDGQTFDPSMVLQPGSAFSTTWRVVNEGSCVWTEDYVWIFVGGDRMSAPDGIPIGEEVQPGEIVEVTLHLIAPQSEGVNTGYWMLQDPSGTIFGVRPDANCSFFVSIFVSTDPNAQYPGDYEIPRLCLDVTPNRTQEPLTETPTERPSPTQPPAAAIPTITPLPSATNTPSHPPIPIYDEFRNIRFREAGPYVPEFTTSIPSPLDVSLDPTVIGTNLLLAALLMIPFVYANASLSRMLEEGRERRARRQGPPRRLRKIGECFGSNLKVNAKGRIVFSDKLRVLILILFYGLVFSLLDPAWKPFSQEGVLLFLSMTVVYGLVGMADDFIRASRIRKWKMPAHLTIKPANLMLSIASVALSRALFLMPGLMFGTPELLQTDEEAISPKRRKQLTIISMITFTSIALTAWIPTIFTRQLLQGNPGELDANMVILAGVEALLLIIFAVTIENFFIQMLGFPGSFGRRFQRSNRGLWFVSLIAITFLFIHTLINPRGDLMQALQRGHVTVFIAVVVVFIVAVFSAKGVLRLRKRRK